MKTDDNECQDANTKVFVRPPSGKTVQEKCQCKHLPPSVPTTHKGGLGTAQFLFEPTPPNHKRASHASSPHIRKIQSAKARLVPSSANNVKDSTILPSGGVRDRQRPRSASGSNPHDVINRHRPGSAVGNRPVPKQFLVLETKEANPSRGKDLEAGIHDGLESHKVASNETEDAQIRRWKERKKEVQKMEQLIPEGLAQLRPWLTQDVPMEWCGVDASSCLVFLPLLLQDSEDLPVVPPAQGANDVIPHTVIPPPPKPFDPKKLFHYDVEKHIPPDPTPEQRSHTRQSRNGIYATDGSLLHDQERYLMNRTEEMIQQEIEDLENLIQGIGNADSNNVMSQYQAEISKLQWSVKDTLVKCYQLRSHFKDDKQDEQTDLLGLRAYIKEKERILNQIKARREACLLELEQLESEIGMTTQGEVMKAFQRL
ncbi:uncharacterized protein [Asterias amurensis]|uniref:uncharacterized protein n=1 Tax=Asterias amurensis TaxID=7602 RepID=UPI003AB1A2AC